MDRYRVTLTPDGRKFGILDRELYAYCTLQDEHKNLLPLEWDLRPAAEAWLHRCYRMWQVWESDGGGQDVGIAPKNWRPAPPEMSPFDRESKYYN